VIAARRVISPIEWEIKKEIESVAFALKPVRWAAINDPNQ
jgi:hypothetical protein